MTKKRALEILIRNWAQPSIIGAAEVKEVADVEISGESALETLSRIAEIPELLEIEPYDFKTANRLLAFAEVSLARESKLGNS